MVDPAEILVICARSSLSPARQARLRELITPSLDWAGLIELAERHGIVPLLSHHLTATVGAELPPWVADELHARTTGIVGRNLMMTAELVRVVRRLEAAGISALPYKGPSLAQVAYGSLGLRSFDDLDLLVPRRHVRDAVGLMLEDGYEPAYRLTPAQERVYFRTQCEYIVEREDVRVELHWAIVPRYFSWPIDLDRLWARATPTTLAGATLLTLCSEDLLLVLCAHGSKHCWDRLEWIASLAEVVRRFPALDWADVDAAARRAGARRMLAVALALAGDLMEVELAPPARIHVERDPAARELAREVGRRILSGERGLLDRSAEIRFHLRARERLRDRLRYAARLGTTQTLGDWELVDLPRGGDALYRVIRPLRLLTKFGPRTIARALGGVTTRDPRGDAARSHPLPHERR